MKMHIMVIWKWKTFLELAVDDLHISTCKHITTLSSIGLDDKNIGVRDSNVEVVSFNPWNQVQGKENGHYKGQNK